MSLIQPGHLLVYECTDSKTFDVYGFQIQNVEDGLTFGVALISALHPVEDYAPKTRLTCTEDALEAGRALILPSRGALVAGADTLSDGDTVEDRTPPFLLSRALYARLVSGERVELELSGATVELTEADEHALDSDARAAVERFAAHSRDVLIARGDGATLVTARDASYPVLVHLAWGGERCLSLQRVLEG